ncbi:MAG TPA: hypothetical protein VGH27_05840 [Streptosporangiaceae bacterium]|jgi:hypothetical protein
MSSARAARLRRMGMAAVLLAATATTGAGAAQARTAGTARSQAVSVAGTISTVAGGVGGPALGSTVALGGISFDACGVTYGAGSLYIGDHLTVREVDPVSGQLTTPVGTGGDLPDGSGDSPLGDGGPATAATLSYACGVALDHSGNLVVADAGTSRIRVTAARTGTFYGQKMHKGDIYTVAGNGTAGYAGDGGPASAAELDALRGVAVDAAGNLVIADFGNDRVRVVAAGTGTFYGRKMHKDDIYTVAGDGTRGYAGDGGPATSAELSNPGDVAVDGAGNLVIADTANFRVRVVAAGTGLFYGQQMTVGHIYTIAGDGTAGFSGDGGPATSAGLGEGWGVAVDHDGNVLIADAQNDRVRVVAASSGTFYGQPMTTGDIYTVAGDGTAGYTGDGGPAVSSGLDYPSQVTVDGSGNLVIADALNHRVRVVAASTGTFYGQDMTTGDIYTVAGNGDPQFSGDGGPATRAELSGSYSVATGPGVTMAVSDWENGRIRVVPASTGTLFGQSMTAGDMYTIAGDGRFGDTGDGGPGPAAELNQVWGVAVDQDGNVLMADTQNSAIRVVAARTGEFYGQAMTAGDIYGPAVLNSTPLPIYRPLDVAVDQWGDVVIADSGENMVLVLAARTGMYYGQAMTAGTLYRVAGGGDGGLGLGGPALDSGLGAPQGVAVDGNGNLLITRSVDQILLVAASTGTFYGQKMTAGYLYSIAGNGTYGHSGDGGPATSAELGWVYGVTVDGSGNVVIADTTNDRIRVVAAKTGTFYGQQMTQGDIYTVAGDGTPGLSGDGGPATSAELSHPQEVAVASSGNLLIADTYTNRIRSVAG